MSFQISTAKFDITPAPGANPYMAGYGVQTALRIVESDCPYADPLLARCVILWDDGKPHAIVSLDVLGIPRSMHLALRPRLIALANWPSSRIVLVATHTHNGPVIGDSLHPFIAYDIVDLGLVRQYTAWLQDRIVDLVRTALAADPHVGDPHVPSRIGGLLPQSRGAADRGDRDSGDRRRAQQRIACTRCCSVTDVTPSAPAGRSSGTGTGPRGRARSSRIRPALSRCSCPGRRATRIRPACGDGPSATVTAGRLATEVKAAVDGYGRELTGPISSAIREITLPLDITPTPANLAAVRAAYRRLGWAIPWDSPRSYQRHAEIDDHPDRQRRLRPERPQSVSGVANRRESGAEDGVRGR